MSPLLVLRADATREVGAGHVMRSAALGAAWRAIGGTAVVWGRVDLDFVRHHLDANRLPIVTAASGGDALVVDSYDESIRVGLATDWRFRVRVLVEDSDTDVAAGYTCIWNPGPGGGQASYGGFSGVVLHGPHLVPVRDGLPGWKPDRASLSFAVLLGGGAQDDRIRKVLALLARRRGEQLLTTVTEPPSPWERLGGTEFWQRVARCTSVVTAGGTTLLEAAAVGVPVVVLQVADNQAANAEWAKSNGVPVRAFRSADTAEEIAGWIETALPAARPLPRLTNGAVGVARELRRILSTVVSV